MPLLTIVLTLALSQNAFSYSNVGLASDLAAVAMRYPRSTLVGEYLYIAREEIRDFVTGIGLSGAGATRRLRISFESARGNREPMYPACADVQRSLEVRYGRPQAVREFSEEASPRSDRIWTAVDEEMTLVCFQPPGRRVRFMAEALVIVRR